MSSDNEPVKLTEEIRTEEEPVDDLVKPLDTVSPEDLQTEYEETKPNAVSEETPYIETAKVEELKLAEEKIRKAKSKRSGSVESESKLHGELRKHSVARKKTDLAVKLIEKQLKALMLAHHSAIKDLQKQVTQIRTKLATIESKKSTATKGARKTTTKKSKRTSKKPIKKR